MKKLDPYTEYLLAQKIKSELNGQYTVFFNQEFEFSDSVASVSGYVDEYYKTYGGWAEPPHYELISRTADFDYIIVSYNDESTVKLDSDSIYNIEKLVEEE